MSGPRLILLIGGLLTMALLGAACGADETSGDAAAEPQAPEPQAPEPTFATAPAASSSSEQAAAEEQPSAGVVAVDDAGFSDRVRAQLDRVFSSSEEPVLIAAAEVRGEQASGVAFQVRDGKPRVAAVTEVGPAGYTTVSVNGPTADDELGDRVLVPLFMATTPASVDGGGPVANVSVSGVARAPATRVRAVLADGSTRELDVVPLAGAELLGAWSAVFVNGESVPVQFEALDADGTVLDQTVRSAPTPPDAG